MKKQIFFMKTPFFLSFQTIGYKATPSTKGFENFCVRGYMVASKISFFFIQITFILNLFIYLFMAVLGLRFFFVQGLSPVVASGGHSSSRCAGLSLSRPLLLRSTGSRRAGSAVVAHGPSRSTACGILPDQGSNPRPLHWQADSQPLHHQGSPKISF